MFTSVLVANRGEIAVRVCKTLRNMGIRSVVVASIPDRRSLAVRTADDWVLLEGYSATESYLDVDAVIAAAKEKGCEAIHPGYGFLSERADFAERCASEGIVFIGPPPAVLQRLGDKSAARQLAVANGVPVVPGWDGVDDYATLIAKAAEIGFPVMIKARGGGGGRGMRPVHDPAELPEAIESARREAAAAFGDDGLLLEKLLTNAHHVEVQVMADAHGHLIHLGERDCSVQRRRQKLIEESPSPVVDQALRAELTGAALKLARAVGYVNAGTFEFLVGTPSSPGKGARAGPRPFYFLEVNPRLQVEHPVTEMVTGLDLVEWQLRIAAGEPLPLTQEQVTFTGHAIEFRINAEDPWNDFHPSSGRITFGHWGEVLARCDIGFDEGDAVPTQYDSLVGKVLVHADNRDDAIEFADLELEGTYLRPLKANVDLHRAILRSAAFTEGQTSVDWLESGLRSLLERGVPPPKAWAAAAVALLSPRQWRRPGGEQIWLTDDHVIAVVQVTFISDRDGLATVRLCGELTDTEFSILRAKDVHEVWSREFSIAMGPGCSANTRQRGDTVYCDFDGTTYSVSLVPPPPLPRRAHAAAEGATAVTAPLAGTIAAVRVAVGDVVEVGQLLATLEAMKMEHRITATDAGTVSSVAVAPGDVVREGDVLVELA